MLVVETIAKIRRAYFLQRKPIKQICRELRVSRNTVRKVVRSGATEFSYDRANPAPRSIRGGPIWMRCWPRMTGNPSASD